MFSIVLMLVKSAVNVFQPIALPAVYLVHQQILNELVHFIWRSVNDLISDFITPRVIVSGRFQQGKCITHPVGIGILISNDHLSNLMVITSVDAGIRGSTDSPVPLSINPFCSLRSRIFLSSAYLFSSVLIRLHSSSSEYSNVLR